MITRFVLALLMAVAVGNDRGCRWARDAVPTPSDWEHQPSAAEKKALDEVLGKWEQSTAATKNYRYTFRRWTYAPGFGPPDTFARYSEGATEITMPDKWHWTVNRTLVYQPPRKFGGKPVYVPAGESERHDWSYDGDWFSEADFSGKEVWRTQMPPESKRGLCVLLGPCHIAIGEPLRLLGKIDRHELARQYRLRLLSPSVSGGHYQIEAVPRDLDQSLDAGARVIVLDRERCFPRALLCYKSSHVTEYNRPQTCFEFTQGDPRVADGTDFEVTQVSVRPGWKLERTHWPSDHER